VRPNYSEKEVLDICTPFFKDIGETSFQLKLTVGGSPCIIISRNAGGPKPIMGVYYTGDEWIPVKWTNEGRFINNDHPRKLDIDLVKEEQEYA
jgi:hypothetical protein